jgi:hypothetical protein
MKIGWDLGRNSELISIGDGMLSFSVLFAITNRDSPLVRSNSCSSILSG